MALITSDRAASPVSELSWFDLAFNQVDGVAEWIRHSVLNLVGYTRCMGSSSIADSAPQASSQLSCPSL